MGHSGEDLTVSNKIAPDLNPEFIPFARVLAYLLRRGDDNEWIHVLAYQTPGIRLEDYMKAFDYADVVNREYVCHQLKFEWSLADRCNMNGYR